MVALGLLTTSILAMVAGGLYWSTGRHILRTRHDRSHPAVSAHALGWFALGVMLFTDAGRFLIGLMPVPDPDLYIALVWAKIMLTATAFGGLAAYITFAWTGRRLAYGVGAVVGAIHGAFWMASTNAALPGTLIIGSWATRMEFTAGVGVPGGPTVGPIMFLAPFAILQIAYLAFWPRVETRGQKFRLGAVAYALLLFMIAGAVQGNPDIDPNGPALAVNMGLMVMGGVMANLAFAPPASWRDRFGIEPLGR